MNPLNLEPEPVLRSDLLPLKPVKNPDFSPDSMVLVLAAADPNAKPVPVPNLTGSSEVLGVESAEPLPKTAPEIVKKKCQNQ